jgi:hypothetical protein
MRTVQSAQYYRGQAELCLELAQQISDPRDADQLRLEAADYFARALDIEAQSGPAPDGETPGTGKTK